jgi:Flp pilus assembly protein TadD
MAGAEKQGSMSRSATRSLPACAAVAASLMLGACAMGDLKPPSLAAVDSAPAPTQTAGATGAPQTELERAVDYWGKEYAKDPRKLDPALAYAKNLKAMGQKSQAMQVLQQASNYHASDRKLASEYGRLALEMDQIGTAQQLLAAADDPANPDWRVISAMGTVLAKQGKYAEAIPVYERALTLARDQPSILNNLALAYMMSGNAAKAEPLLRQAAQLKGADDKVRQNLALVLGVQGRHDEASQVAAQSATPEAVAYNDGVMRKLVKAEPVKGAPKAATTQVAGGAARGMKPTATADAAAASWASRVAVAGDEPPPAAIRGAAN